MAVASREHSADPQHRESSDIENLFHGLIEHQAFKSTPVLRSVLIFLWRHQREPVSEYAIGVDALARPSNFDPKTDASVRVLIGRLRAKLKDFNATESYPLKLTIPVGTHEIRWALEELPVKESAPPVQVAAPRGDLKKSSSYIQYGLVALALLLAISCAVLFQQNRALRRSSASSVVPLPRFWKSFLAGGKAPVIVLPSPVHVFWPDKNLVARDVTISDFTDWSKSPGLQELAKRWGPPSLTQRYVGVVDMEAGLAVMNFLQNAGVQASVVDSSHFPTVSMGSDRVISIGFPNRTAYLTAQLSNTEFSLSDSLTGPVVVNRRNPRVGQPHEYREIDYSPTHKIYPSLIALLPRTADGSQSLVLLGMLAKGLVSLLTAPSNLEQLEDQWRKAGSPDAWEAVVNEEVNDKTVMRVWAVAIRPIRGDQEMESGK